MMERVLSWNYLKTYCHILKETEVPPRFAIWCGIASLLAALERRVWINQGIYTIYPNFYIVLVAASGQKKSTAVNLAAKLLRKISNGPNVISQKITPEALITAIQCAPEEGTKVLVTPKAGGIVIADELATFLDRGALDRGLGPMLTALYDCTPFEYNTKARGIERIEDGYLSILGGSTIELLRSSLPKDAIGGGFTSRTMFVYEELTPAPIPWIDFNQELVDMEQTLVNYLQRVRELEGPILLTSQAKQLYIDDYHARHKNSSLRHDPFLRNYENRRHAHLFKVAIALMICEEPRQQLELDHIRGAMEILEDAETYLPRVMELLTATDTGHMSAMVLGFIRNSEGHEATRQDVMRQFSNRMNAQELTKVLETLIQAHQIEADISVRGKMVYRLK